MSINLNVGGPKTAPDQAADQQQGQAAPASGNIPSFMKTGDAAQADIQKEEALAAKRAEESGKLWRFMISKKALNEDRIVTFLDGNLNEKGILDAPTWKEHTVQISGRWENIVCISEQEPCPLCENSDNYSLVAGFTVIDHTPYTIQNGPNAGTTIQKSKKLYIAKRSTLGILQKKAAKQGGLAGVTMEISRTGPKDPNVGNVFDVVDKKPIEQIRQEMVALGLDPSIADPADWAKEITYRNRTELADLGLVGSMSMVGGDAPSTDLAAEL